VSAFVLGIDLGKTVGWALLHFDRGERPTVVGCGTWTEAEALAREARAGDVLAIEYAKEIQHSMVRLGGGALVSTVAGLLAENWLGGEIAGLTRAAGGTVHRVTASEARLGAGVQIGGRARHGIKPPSVDTQVGNVVPLLIRAWPKRSNAHERDAALAAHHVGTRVLRLL
jgi:hypothetical protein